MEVARIDGIKTHLDHLTDEELAGHLMYAANRVEAAQGDLNTLQNELFRRMNIELPFDVPILGNTAIREEIDYDQALQGYSETA